MKYSVIAWDKPGPEGVELRDALRAAHMEAITQRFHEGNVIFGAGFYDDEGLVRGSLVILDVESRADVDAYLETEPFVTGELWATVEVSELKVPDMYTERMGPTVR